MIHIDTSALVDALTGRRRSAPDLRRFIERGEQVQVSAIVLYEWLRGPRQPDELKDQELLFPQDAAVAFGAAEAARAARLYTRVPRARGREIDLAIAACALVHNAALWTLNRDDFADIPDLILAD
ncbi:MAG: type II toxin-antitoxin system VapC family toxin [Acidobacteria bacterium]|nr:type II toxin-antitoxin system VapC family toxin [Acidobacteriota bacterium]